MPIGDSPSIDEPISMPYISIKPLFIIGDSFFFRIVMLVTGISISNISITATDNKGKEVPVSEVDADYYFEKTGGDVTIIASADITLEKPASVPMICAAKKVVDW